MPVEVRNSPPPLHQPGDSNIRPRGILKNPSFSAASGQQASPTKDDFPQAPPSGHLNPQEERDLTLQNTLQNAGHRRSSSGVRRASMSRRQSSTAGSNHEDDPDTMRLKWDEANLYLAEQESGGRMKITEPKTPYQYGTEAMEDDDDEDVAIDPRYVNVDEMDLARNKSHKKARESDIPGLELGEPTDDFAQGVGVENDRIVRRSSMSRETSKEKHVSVSSGSGEGLGEQIGMPDQAEEEKHRQFEERRKRHYEMKDVKGLLGHPEENDVEDDDETSLPTNMPTNLPNRGVNGVR